MKRKQKVKCSECPRWFNQTYHTQKTCSLECSRKRDKRIAKIYRDKRKKCVVCGTKIETYNKSGYCTKCYVTSPQYLEYQREYQRELRKNPVHQKKVAKYNSRPEVLKHKQEYQRAWMKKHPERMAELRHRWYVKHKGEKK